MLLHNVKYIVTVEEHLEEGGLGSIVLELLNKFLTELSSLLVCLCPGFILILCYFLI